MEYISTGTNYDWTGIKFLEEVRYVWTDVRDIWTGIKYDWVRDVWTNTNYIWTGVKFVWTEEKCLGKRKLSGQE